MPKIIGLLGLAVFLVVGCKPKGPQGVELKRIPDSTFVRVMAELFVLEGAHTQAIRRADVPQIIFDAYKGPFERHDVSFGDFQSTLDYWKLNPKPFVPLLDSVIAYIPVLKQQYADSIPAGNEVEIKDLTEVFPNRP